MSTEMPVRVGTKPLVTGMPKYRKTFLVKTHKDVLNLKILYHLYDDVVFNVIAIRI